MRACQGLWGDVVSSNLFVCWWLLSGKAGFGHTASSLSATELLLCSSAADKAPAGWRLFCFLLQTCFLCLQVLMLSRHNCHLSCSKFFIGVHHLRQSKFSRNMFAIVWACTRAGSWDPWLQLPFFWVNYNINHIAALHKHLTGGCNHSPTSLFEIW